MPVVPALNSSTIRDTGHRADARSTAHAYDCRMVRPTQFRLPTAGRILVAITPAERRMNHHWNAGSQRMAYDLLFTDGANALHRGDGTKLTDWHGFGRHVFAPAAGTVVEAVDGFRDLLPTTDPDTVPESGRFPAGNHLTLRLDDGSYLLLAHLRHGSVRQALRGARIAAGTYIGDVGNSGNSTGVHLHVQRHSGAVDLFDPRARAMPLAFSGYTIHASYRVDSKGRFVDGRADGRLVTQPTIPLRGQLVESIGASHAASFQSPAEH